MTSFFQKKIDFSPSLKRFPQGIRLGEGLFVYALCGAAGKIPLCAVGVLHTGKRCFFQRNSKVVDVDDVAILRICAVLVAEAAIFSMFIVV